MSSRVIGFVPPVVGISDRFNTFRLGLFYHKRLIVGETVYLLDEKEKQIIGSATVERIELGKLSEMCQLHASTNHSEIENNPEAAPDNLMKTLCKLYGPQIATPDKKTTVIFLKRVRCLDLKTQYTSEGIKEYKSPAY
jgi:hypothetical protein